MMKYKEIIYQLTRPVSYLFLNHSAGKIYNWKIPGFFTMLSLIILFLFVKIELIIGKSGLIENLSDFVSIFPGFFIASLAAISTFNRPEIDQVMPNAPTIDIMISSGDMRKCALTRRAFLLRLFSFLTVNSLFLILVPKAVFIFSIPSYFYIPYNILEWLFVGIFLLFFWQLIILLLFGMYYLCERLTLTS